MKKNSYQNTNQSLPPANEVCGKVIFSKVCVSHSVHGGGRACGWGRGRGRTGLKRAVRILLECIVVFKFGLI